MRAASLTLVLAILMFFAGCIPVSGFGLGGSSGAKSEGSEKSARNHFADEMNKWMTGQKSDAQTIKHILSTPIKFEILSAIPDKPYLVFTKDGDTPPDDWNTYRLNVSITFESQAGTPLENVVAYSITWNREEKAWILKEIM